MSYFGKITNVDNKSSDIDLVTRADIKTEEFIIQAIRKEFPQHNIITEESDFDSIDEWDKEMDSYRRAISKTESFKQFVEDRIEKGQRGSSLIGNQYTGSIFLALMSTFEADYEENANLDNVTLGLCGYGSGAKAKVFEAEVQPTWREIASRWNLFERLEGRIAIDRVTYEALHKGLAKESIITPKGEFALVEVGDEGVEEGMRTYAWVGE